MVYEEIYSEPVYRSFRASSCSWGAFYMKIINTLKVFLPILVIFFTEGLWKKTGTFREVPNISFDGDYIVFAYSPEQTIMTSTFGVLNSAASVDQLSTSQVSHYMENIPENNNRILNINFEMDTKNKSFSSLTFAFFLDFQLDYHSIVEANLILSDTIQFSSPTSQVITTSRLGVDQTSPFRGKEDIQSIDRTRKDVQHFQIRSVLERQSNAPISLEMKRKSCIHLSTNSPPPTIKLSMHLSIPEIEFVYKTGFWELLKWAWIQYLAIFVIFTYIFNSISGYLFRNRIFYSSVLFKDK